MAGDTDKDGVLDIYETGTGIFVSSTNTGTSPTDSDTDNDGVSDGVEILEKTNPVSATSFNLFSTGMIAFLPLDGNALDISGGGLSGVNQGAIPTDDREGKPSGAFAFNGSSFVDFGAQIQLGAPNSSSTVTLWVKALGTGPIFGDYEGTASVGDEIYSVNMQVEAGTNFLLMSSRNYPARSRDYTLFRGNTPMNDGKWHSLVYSIDGLTSCRVYVDSVPKGTIPYDGTLNYTAAQRWQIGRLLFAGQAQFFTGMVDDIRIYNRALSNADVLNLYRLESHDRDGDGIKDQFETGGGNYVSPTDTGSNPDLADSDVDGLSDGDEINIYTSNPNLKDSDNDGFDDLFEVNTGFNPALVTSTPDAISSIRTAVEFRFNAANGVHYRIEESTDLTNWNTIEADIVGQGGEVVRFYSIQNQQRKYFRPRRNP